MNSKHVCIGFLMLFGIASGVTACGGADGEGSTEEQVGDDEASAQPSDDDVEFHQAAPPERFPNCGILACPDGTVCMFDSEGEATCAAQKAPNCGIVACPTGTVCMFDAEGEARCGAPDAQTCDVVDCGAYHHCVMTDIGAICMPGPAES